MNNQNQIYILRTFKFWIQMTQPVPMNHTTHTHASQYVGRNWQINWKNINIKSKVKAILCFWLIESTIIWLRFWLNSILKFKCTKWNPLYNIRISNFIFNAQQRGTEHLVFYAENDNESVKNNSFDFIGA